MSDSEAIRGGTSSSTVHDRPAGRTRQESRLDRGRERRYNPPSDRWQDRPAAQARRPSPSDGPAGSRGVAPAGRVGAAGTVEAGAAASSLPAAPTVRLT